MSFDAEETRALRNNSVLNTLIAVQSLRDAMLLRVRFGLFFASSGHSLNDDFGMALCGADQGCRAAIEISWAYPNRTRCGA